MGKKPYICIWDLRPIATALATGRDTTRGANTKEPLKRQVLDQHTSFQYTCSSQDMIYFDCFRIGKGFFDRGICAICFSEDAKFLAGVGCDDHHSMGIWEVGLGYCIFSCSSTQICPHTLSQVSSGTMLVTSTCQNGLPPMIKGLCWSDNHDSTGDLN